MKKGNEYSKDVVLENKIKGMLICLFYVYW